MFVLFETPGGYGLFKVMDNSLLKDKSKLRKQFEKASSAQKALSLVDFHKFANTTEALSASTALVESKLHTSLRRFLRNQIKGKEGFTLGVSDTKLGKAISSKLNCSIAADENVQTILRGIRLHLDSFLSSQPSSSSDATTNMNMMRLGLAHSLSRYKLKFSPDKVDTMIVQAIALLDDLDKELNNYAMRCREWYGWHFPELSKLIADHQTFARVVRLMGDRFSATKVDLSSVLPEDLVEEVRNVAKVSMGTDIAEEDIQNVISLCDQVIALGEYREQLYDYLKNRMQAIAPNLTTLVGERVGARLIAKAGSLMNLAKCPASTVQILGAEKALFRALKTKHNTPKYGLIYHASLVGQASAKNKGKMSRMLSAKAVLSVRLDALGGDDAPSIAVDARAKLENRSRQMEGISLYQGSATSKGGAAFERYDSNKDCARSSARGAYSTKDDSTVAAPSRGPDHGATPGHS